MATAISRAYPDDIVVSTRPGLVLVLASDDQVQMLKMRPVFDDVLNRRVRCDGCMPDELLTRPLILPIDLKLIARVFEPWCVAHVREHVARLTRIF